MTYRCDTVLTACTRAPRMCGSRYCWRAREGVGRACSLRWPSARAVRARTRHHNRSGPHKRPAAAPCKPRACRAPAAAALAMPVTSWTFTAGLAKSLPSKSSITCVQEGREVKVSTVRRAACALHEAKRTRYTQGARLKNRVRGFAGSGPHLTSGPHARRQPRSLHTATSRACPRRPLP